jgi:membrane protein CcdC involved in cytochrome C biogenesis
MGLVVLGAISMCIAAIVLCIKLRKTKHPARVARVFAFIALACGIINLFCDFFPFEYNGPGGIDYIGQAIVWGMVYSAMLYSTLATYVIFAIAATAYAIKASKAKDKRRKGWLTLIISWVCALVVAGIVLTNIVSDNNRKKNISVEVREVTETVDSDGEPAVIVVMEFKNNRKSETFYHAAVYDEVSQNGKELPHASIEELIGKDYDLEEVAPGSSVIVKKAFKLKDPDAPVHILCRTYGGDYTYVDKDFVIGYK